MAQQLTLAGRTYTLPPIDGFRGITILNLVQEVSDQVADLQAQYQQHEHSAAAANWKRLTPEEALSPEWKDRILSMEPEATEELLAQHGYRLKLSADHPEYVPPPTEFQIAIRLLGEALDQIPNTVYNVVAALVMPAETLWKADEDGTLEEEVKVKAKEIYKGSAETGYVGATFEEIGAAMLVAFEAAKDQAEALRPLGERMGLNRAQRRAVAKASGGASKRRRQPSPIASPPSTEEAPTSSETSASEEPSSSSS